MMTRLQPQGGATSEPSSDRRPRGPGMVLGVVVLALLLIVATFALTARNPAPPSIAEFAPQAFDRIDEPSDDQAARRNGTDPGDSIEDASPSPPASTQIVARARRCVGDPPRQTEDPQSPPCVPAWSGDNGGSTHHGVTRETIRIGMPDNMPRVITDLEAYFNSRYEFYGRRIQLVHSPSASAKCPDRQAAAVNAAERLQVFGALDARNGGGGDCFNSELARQKRMSFVHGPVFTEEQLSAVRPYLWQYTMSADQIFTAAGQMICARLAGGAAKHSPDPVLAAKPRKFGVVVQDSREQFDTSALDRALRACGERIAVRTAIDPTQGQAGVNAPAAATAMLRFKNEDVTTIINLGSAFTEHQIAAAAEANAYFPEWIFTTYGGNNSNTVITAFWQPASQRRSIIGLDAMPSMRSWSSDPQFLAGREVDPELPQDPDPNGATHTFIHQYRAMLVLASGIQMAGPRLTPSTFESALQRARFPYPANDPSRSGDVGFVGDHAMTQGVTEFWWSESTQSPSGYVSAGSPGAVCYLDHGARRRVGAWPATGDVFFQGDCDPGPR